MRQFWMACLFSVLLFGSPSSPASGQTAPQLFYEMQMALGGAEKIAAIHDFDQTVRADTWDRQGTRLGTAHKRVRWIRPNYLRIDQSRPYDTYVLFFDGTAGWEIMPDKSVRDFSGGELTFAKNYVHGLDFNVWLADRDPRKFTYLPETQCGCDHTQADTSRSTKITLDPVTRLRVKQEGTSHSDPNHAVSAYTLPDEWRTINGVKFAGRIRNFHEGRMLAEINVEAMQVNRGISFRDLSTKPRDLKPVISGR